MNQNMKTYLGISTGVSGALAVLRPDDTWLLAPTASGDGGKSRLPDLPASRQFLLSVCREAGGAGHLLAACEMPPRKPRFGARGNFDSGRRVEFWRVLLGLTEVSCLAVEPRAWQRQIFRGIPGIKPRRLARLFLEQRYPRVDLRGFPGAEGQEAVRDAMCIALWARINSPEPDSSLERTAPSNHQNTGGHHEHP